MKNRKMIIGLCLGGLMAQVGCKSYVGYREDGWEAYRQEDYAEAAENFAEAVDRKPSDYLSQYYLGVSLLKQEQAVAAQTPLEQALMIAPENPQWTPQIADAVAESYYQQGRVEKLYAFLDQMIADYNQQSYDFLRKAKYLGMVGDADGQKLALTKAGQFAPMGDATPYLAQAEFYLSYNDVPAALQALRYGYYVDPSNEAVQDQLRGQGIVPGPTQAERPPKAILLDQ